MIQFVRILWGDFDKYQAQIKLAKEDNLGEVVYVWGRTNYEKLISLGYICRLISDEPFDYSIANAHTFHDYNSLTHKIWGIGRALQDFSEVIFVDWDVRKVKPIDEQFYELIRAKNRTLQVPLYVYPEAAFPQMLADNSNDVLMTNYLSKLEEYVKMYSWKTEIGYVMPNTGFFYCSSVDAISEMLRLIEDKNLRTVPDEFSVFEWAKTTLEYYIERFEPIVIDGKEHDNELWNIAESKLNQFKLNYTAKNIYFKHI